MFCKKILLVLVKFFYRARTPLIKKKRRVPGHAGAEQKCYLPSPIPKIEYFGGYNRFIVIGFCGYVELKNSRAG
jgi:hypothetical protein